MASRVPTGRVSKIPKWGWVAIALGAVGLAYWGYEAATTVVVWGVRVPKSAFTMAQIDVGPGTITSAYAVHNHRLVLQLAEDVAHLQRLGPTSRRPFPPGPHPKPIVEFTLRTKTDGNVGGWFWSVGKGSIIQDAYGSYWAVPPSLVTTLRHDTRVQSTTRLFSLGGS